MAGQNYINTQTVLALKVETNADWSWAVPPGCTAIIEQVTGYIVSPGGTDAEVEMSYNGNLMGGAAVVGTGGSPLFLNGGGPVLQAGDVVLFQFFITGGDAFITLYATAEVSGGGLF